MSCVWLILFREDARFVAPDCRQRRIAIRFAHAIDWGSVSSFDLAKFLQLFFCGRQQHRIGFLYLKRSIRFVQGTGSTFQFRKLLESSCPFVLPENHHPLLTLGLKATPPVSDT